MNYCNYSEFYNNLSSAEKLAAPKEIYWEGDFCILTQGVNVSIVGSRDASKEGLQRARIITEILVSHGITIVSGLAAGIDTMAHTAAIEKGGRTVAVLGTPLDKCSPTFNKSLLERIRKEHLAISQFEIGATIQKSNFPNRNKLMALISDATIVVEATEESGTRHQAWEAIRLNRQVFIMENIVKDRSVNWAHEMLKYGAKILNRENHTDLISSLVEFA